ncbi:hypothetical protein SKM54_04135 [Acinetobacter faecalis]|uniref:hypothetical protein n=1 Tax=Acinetobacter faecalis TaxID=2665161 RepID=UPI002A91B594|nr:hypothetical protein [Acinetobacter faecalis]MDY6481637.1 hypothetical protein [Acinetobacter faecalis]
MFSQNEKFAPTPRCAFISKDFFPSRLASALIVFFSLYITFSIFKDGILLFFSYPSLDKCLLILTVLSMFFAGWFLFSTTFPVYINEYGASYRDFFLKKKSLRWDHVIDILILKKIDTNTYKIFYSFTINSKKNLKLSWSVDIKEKDDYHFFLQTMDYYVKKHDIKICFNDSEFSFKAKLKEIPQKLDFSN